MDVAKLAERIDRLAVTLADRLDRSYLRQRAAGDLDESAALERIAAEVA